MTGHILFEQKHRGDVWRLEIASYQGRDFANWRKWYPDDGELKPTRTGLTIPLQRLPDLHAALAEYLAGDGADTGRLREALPD